MVLYELVIFVCLNSFVINLVSFVKGTYFLFLVATSFNSYLKVRGGAVG
jgi:hypothetical protein